MGEIKKLHTSDRKRIVQLYDYEYQKLFELAKMTDQEVYDLADKMYREKGPASIKIQVAIGDNRHYNYDRFHDIMIDVDSYVASSEIYKFSLSNSEARKIKTFVDNKVLQYMQAKFGENINKLNYLERDIRSFSNLRKSFLIITVLGWIIAGILLILA